MLRDSFEQIYAKFKLHFYRQVFSSSLQSREATLTTVETFCMEIIHAMGHPTINEFANFIEISSPNAAYKVNSLIQKGYLKKVQSENDRREYHLYPTEKYMKYYNVSYNYLDKVMERIQGHFTPEQTKELSQMLEEICDELMPEIPLPKLKENSSEEAEETK